MSCAISAAGLISSLGNTSEALYEQLLQGAPPPTARAIRDFEPRAYLDRKGLKHLSRTSQLACAAASRVVGDLDGVDSAEVGVVFGTAWASLDSIVRFEREAHVEGPRFVDPILFTETVANVPAGQVSIFFGWSALNATTSAGSASGLEALARAAEFLEQGRAKAIVAGGGDALSAPLLTTLEADGRLDPSWQAIPWAPGATAPVAGEGVCLLVLESPDRAAARGVRARGHLAAAMGQLLPVGGEVAITTRRRLLHDVLERAGIEPRDLDLVVLAANGDPQTDALEATLLSGLLRDAGGEAPALMLPKAWLGETWGASGALAVALALEAMASGRVPGHPFPVRSDLDLPALPGQPQSRHVRRALVIDGDATGHFAALVLERPEG